MLALTTNVALAVTREGGAGDEILGGTDDRDAIYGYPGNDELYGYGGEDYLIDGTGDDYIDAGDDSVMDFIDCDPGSTRSKPTPLVDVLHNCEYVVS